MMHGLTINYILPTIAIWVNVTLTGIPLRDL